MAGSDSAISSSSTCLLWHGPGLVPVTVRLPTHATIRNIPTFLDLLALPLILIKQICDSPSYPVLGRDGSCNPCRPNQRSIISCSAALEHSATRPVLYAGLQPQARSDHSCSIWHYCDDGVWKDLVVCFGGSTDRGLENDVWLLDLRWNKSAVFILLRPVYCGSTSIKLKNLADCCIMVHWTMSMISVVMHQMDRGFLCWRITCKALITCHGRRW